MGASVAAGPARGPAAGGATAADTIDPRFSRPRTLFFGLGAQKSGTSWLDHYLRGHPEVCLPPRKEQHYWTRRSEGAAGRLARVAAQVRAIEERSLWRRLTRSPKRRAADEAWRRAEAMLSDRSPGHAAYADAVFQSYRGQPVAGEITPAYALVAAETFAEMAAIAADVRFVFVMRDPVDRLFSGLSMNVRKGRSDVRPVTGGFAERLDAALSDPEDTGILRSRYDRTITRLESVAPHARIGYFFFETLFAQAEIDRLADFLGIARRPAHFERKVNAKPRLAAGADAEARALAALAPVYDFVRGRFGAQTPERWRTPPQPAVGAAAQASR